MENQFYILKEGEKRGPYTAEELELMRIKKLDLIAISENATWTEAYKIKELAYLFQEKEKASEISSHPTTISSISEKTDHNYNSPYGFGSGYIEFLNNGTIKIDYPTEIIYYRYASFGERFVSRLIDVLIVFIPAFMIPIVAPWLYFSLQQSGDSQQTIGQRASDIKLISANGRKVDFGQATGRHFANYLNLFTLGIGFLMFFFSSRSQCLHDSLANTLVVSELKREKK